MKAVDRGPRRAAGAAGVLLALAPWPAGAPADVREDVESILRARGELEERSEETVVRDLVALGEPAIGELFELVHGGATDELLRARGTEGWWQGAPDRFGELACRALGHLSDRRVVEYLERRSRGEADVLLRRDALRVLEELGSARGLSLAVRFARQVEEVELRYPSLRGPLVRALSAMLASDRAAVDDLPDLLGRASEGVLDVVVESLGRARCAGANELLLQLLGRSAALDAAAAEQLGELARQAPWRSRTDPQPALERLADEPNWRVRRAALVALGRVAQPESLFTLVDALEDEDERVRRSARWALAQVSGTEAPRSGEEWERWFDERQDAWLRDREAFPSHLADLEPGEALEAVRRHAQRNLFRHRAAEVLTEALEHESPAVVQAACGALHRLGSRHAVPPLVELLRSYEAGVRHAAWRALCGLTDQELPPDPERWEAFANS